MTGNSEQLQQARWEWRCFSTDSMDLTNVFSNLDSFREDHSEEIYFLVKDPDLNLKLRHGLLDLKQRLATHALGYEQWYPVFKAEAVLNSEDYQVLRRYLPGLPSQYILGQGLELLNGHAAITSCTLRKSRLRYAIGEVSAEYTTLTLDERTINTLALEHLDLEHLHQVRKEYNLLTLPNASYPAGLKHVLNL